MKSSFLEITAHHTTPKNKNLKCPFPFFLGPSPAEEPPKEHGGPPMPSRGRAEAAPAQPSPRDPATARGAAGSRLVGGDSAPLPDTNLIPGTHSLPGAAFPKEETPGRWGQPSETKPRLKARGGNP